MRQLQLLIALALAALTHAAALPALTGREPAPFICFRSGACSRSFRRRGVLRPTSGMRRRDRRGVRRRAGRRRASEFGGVFTEELETGARAWHETYAKYGVQLEDCMRLSNKPGDH